MSIKIEIKGSGLFCLDTVTGVYIISEPSKYMWYKEDDLLIGRVSFYYANSLEGDEVSKKEIPFFNLSDAVDVNDVAFTEGTLRDFCTANMGKPNAGSTALTTTKSGWGNYVDNISTNISIGTTPVKITFNGLGSTTNTDFFARRQ